MIPVAQYIGMQETGLPDFPDFQLWNLLVPLPNGKSPINSTVSEKQLKLAYPNTHIPTNPKIGDTLYVDEQQLGVAPENHTVKMSFESYFIKALNKI